MIVCFGQTDVQYSRLFTMKLKISAFLGQNSRYSRKIGDHHFPLYSRLNPNVILAEYAKTFRMRLVIDSEDRCSKAVIRRDPAPRLSNTVECFSCCKKETIDPIADLSRKFEDS